MNFYDALTTRRKRGVIWRWTFNHSLILFRGKVFEWGINFTYFMNRRPSSCYINWHRGKKGTSRCSLADIEDWTRAYGKKYTYNLLTNNCHVFSNALAKHLDTNCGRWSSKRNEFWERSNGHWFWNGWCKSFFQWIQVWSRIWGRFKLKNEHFKVARYSTFSCALRKH